MAQELYRLKWYINAMAPSGIHGRWTSRRIIVENHRMELTCYYGEAYFCGYSNKKRLDHSALQDWVLNS